MLGSGSQTEIVIANRLVSLVSTSLTRPARSLALQCQIKTDLINITISESKLGNIMFTCVFSPDRVSSGGK